MAQLTLTRKELRALIDALDAQAAPARMREVCAHEVLREYLVFIADSLPPREVAK
jgi:hypothetical protein